MRWCCWILIGLMLSCTTGCSCGGGHSSLAEMKRRAVRPAADETPSAPAAPATVAAAPAPETPLPPAQPAVVEQPAAVAAPMVPTPAVAAVPPPAREVTPAPMPVLTKEQLPDLPEPVALPAKKPVPPSRPAKTPTDESPDEDVAASNVKPRDEPENTAGAATAESAAVVADTRIPIPDKDAQAISRRLLAELYKEEYDHAKTPEQKKKLAQTLLAKASEISDDVAGHYLQLRLARDLAVQAGDVNLSLQAINALAATYQFDSNAEKLVTLEALAKAVRAQGDAKVFFAECKALLMACVRQDEFNLAAKVLDAAEVVAKRGKINDQLESLEQSRKVLEEMKVAQAIAQPAFSALAENANDAAANLAAGKYRCYYRRQWAAGLANLAEGSDVKLRVLAQIDTSHPTTSDQQAELGDQWYDHSQSITKPWAKSSVQLRAAYWYQLALPGLPSGLIKSRVQKRLSDIANATGDETMKAFVAGKRNVVPLD